jgi:Tfp pilus assembly protein PilZ
MRKFDRRAAELAVMVSSRRGGEKAKGGITLDSADVSEGGAFLRSDLLFEIGETLELEIPVPTGPAIKVVGRVVRVSQGRAESDAPGMGIEFLELAATDREKMRKALAAGSGSKPGLGKAARS